jgi:hypothetical protein
MRAQLLLLIALALAIPALADEIPPPPKMEPAPEIAPPPGVSDADMEPQVTISHRGQDKIEEYRVRGQVYMVKVTPRYGKPYYLVPRKDGQMVRHNDLSPNFVVPMWMIKEF